MYLYRFASVLVKVGRSWGGNWDWDGIAGAAFAAAFVIGAWCLIGYFSGYFG